MTLTNNHTVLTGEIYGKQTSSKFVMYNVLKVSGAASGKFQAVTLQNIDNPLSLFETTAQKLSSAGYVRISQTHILTRPFLAQKRRKCPKNHRAVPIL